MSIIPDSLKDLVERPIVCSLATVMADGQPQVTPVWFKFDGTHVIINTARGRQKDRNMSRNAKVTVGVIDPKDSGHWIEIRGHIVEITEEGGREMINELSHRYENKDFKIPQGQVRVTVKIQPDKVNGE